MSVSAKFQYPISADEMFKHFCDPEYFRNLYEGTGAKEVEIIECSGGNTKTSRLVPANVPSFAKKFLAEWNTVTQTEQWVDSGNGRANTIVSEVDGAPITVNSKATLTDTADGCEFAVTAEAKVSIPLVGKKIAAIVEEDVQATMQREYEFSLNYIKG